MEKVLLVVSDFTLRQLYHEFFFSQQIEIVPVSEIATAVLLLTLEEFTGIILYVVDPPGEIEVFLNLRQKHSLLSQVKLILLVDCHDFYPSLTEKDLLLSLQNTSIEEIRVKIQGFL